MHIRATVILADGRRIKLDAICPRRSDLDQIVAAAFPEHRACLTIIKREASCA
jgi:hypothetical protein